jgi:hypothetical protein
MTTLDNAVGESDITTYGVPHGRLHRAAGTRLNAVNSITLADRITRK